MLSLASSMYNIPGILWIDGRLLHIKGHKDHEQTAGDTGCRGWCRTICWYISLVVRQFYILFV